jgi:ABC-type transport system involved in multi-copper enzyme maturation permease subunit
MIWLTWRQHRKQALFTLIGLAVLAAIMIPIGIVTHHAFVHDGAADCLRKLGNAPLIQQNGPGCDAAVQRFTSQYGNLSQVGQLFIFLPLLVGLFFGAPLVAREVEHGTHRLVWTQGVSRRRWAAVKIALVGAFTLAIATLYGLGLSWWLQPWANNGDGRVGNGMFDMQGIAPIGYTLFAVALGIFAGTVWRKMLPAMAVTLVGFIGVRVAFTVLARTRLLPAKVLTFPITSTMQPNQYSGDWVMDIGVRDPNGKMIAANTMMSCPPQATDCGNQMNITASDYNWQLYQPASRFWPLQGIETGVYVALAVVLIYFAVRRIRRIA